MLFINVFLNVLELFTFIFTLFLIFHLFIICIISNIYYIECFVSSYIYCNKDSIYKEKTMLSKQILKT